MMLSHVSKMDVQQESTSTPFSNSAFIHSTQDSTQTVSKESSLTPAPNESNSTKSPNASSLDPASSVSSLVDASSPLSPTAGPITRALCKGVVRKRSIKRRAPPPPPTSSNLLPQLMDLPTSSGSTETVPPAPQRNHSSHDATKRFHEQGSPITQRENTLTHLPGSQTHPSLSEYEIVNRVLTKSTSLDPVYGNLPPPTSPNLDISSYQYPPLLDNACPVGGPSSQLVSDLSHSISEGCVQRGQLFPSSAPLISGPLVPVVEETESPSGALVPHTYYQQQNHHHQQQQQQQQQQRINNIYSSRDDPTLETDIEDPYGQLHYGSAGGASRRQRLHRSDSVITVAHLYEDLYVISPLIRVTLTNLTGMVVLVALVMPNTAAMLYTFFRYTMSFISRIGSFGYLLFGVFLFAIIYKFSYLLTRKIRPVIF